MRTRIMRDASYLLPPPGGEVVRDLLDSYDALLARHNALREAVAWERECEQLDFWGVAYALCRRHPGNYIDTVRADFYAIRDSARAEVDRLVGVGQYPVAIVEDEKGNLKTEYLWGVRLLQEDK